MPELRPLVAPRRRHAGATAAQHVELRRFGRFRGLARGQRRARATTATPRSPAAVRSRVGVAPPVRTPRLHRARQGDDRSLPALGRSDRAGSRTRAVELPPPAARDGRRVRHMEGFAAAAPMGSGRAEPGRGCTARPSTGRRVRRLSALRPTVLHRGRRRHRRRQAGRRRRASGARLRGTAPTRGRPVRAFRPRRFAHHVRAGVGPRAGVGVARAAGRARRVRSRPAGAGRTRDRRPTPRRRDAPNATPRRRLVRRRRPAALGRRALHRGVYGRRDGTCGHRRRHRAGRSARGHGRCARRARRRARGDRRVRPADLGVGSRQRVHDRVALRPRPPWVRRPVGQGPLALALATHIELGE